MKSKSKRSSSRGPPTPCSPLFQQFGEATSYDLKQAIEISIQNFWPVPHTTAYEEPARLAAAGYLAGARRRAGGAASSTR